jgi:PncC family amidohydrolase
MKFWIEKDTTIFLYQLLKGAKAIENYKDIEHKVSRGFVSVNDEYVYKSRMKIKIGDVVRYQKHHIIVADRNLRDKQEEIPTELIRHGKVKKWETKPLEIEQELNSDIENISKQLHEKIQKRKFSLSLAESCTGGMIQQVITSHPGASAYFLGGVVAYANQIKQYILNVPEKTLEKYGSVSKETVIAMVKGIQTMFQSNCACAITGIAGPDGGTKEKPVGTVHIAVYSKKKVTHHKYIFSGNREIIRKKAAVNALKMLVENL